VIQVMDSYYLTRDDWDACVDLKLGADVTAALDTKTKTAFTKTYNSSNHPTPFLNQAPTKVKGGRAEPKPDLEDVFDDEDVIYDDGEAAEESTNDEDVTKDKYILQPKKSKAKAPAKPRGKAKK